MGEDPDVPAIRRVLDGESAAYGDVVARHHRSLVRFIGGVVGDRHLAEDVAQEVWLIAYRRLNGFAFRARFRTWLFRVALREAASARTRLRRLLARIRPVGLQAAEHDRAAPRDAEASAERREELLALLGRLPRNERAAFVMHVEDFTYLEIAEILRRPPGTVATWIHRARQRLGQAVSGDAGSRPIPIRRAEAKP